jgi:hypothetical protein
MKIIHNKLPVYNSNFRIFASNNLIITELNSDLSSKFSETIGAELQPLQAIASISILLLFLFVQLRIRESQALGKEIKSLKASQKQNLLRKLTSNHDNHDNNITEDDLQTKEAYSTKISEIENKIDSTLTLFQFGKFLKLRLRQPEPPQAEIQLRFVKGYNDTITLPYRTSRMHQNEESNSRFVQTFCQLFISNKNI